jgi:biopolymer transport protein ExbB/TolQ
MRGIEPSPWQATGNALACSVQDPQAVTGGSFQALLATTAGLLIAVCALFPYNDLMSKVEEAALSVPPLSHEANKERVKMAVLPET